MADSTVRGPRRSTRRGSLVVVGTGIRVVAQATLEAIAHIKRAERVYYVVDDPVTEEWLRRLNSTATALNHYYAEGKSRDITYRQMATHLVNAVRAGARVCAAFYGHPGVFVDPSHEAIRRLRRAGYSARMLPGISSEDCLFADLDVDPGLHGCQSFEATDFLACRRRFDPTSALVLWQVGRLGEPSVRDGMQCRPERLAVLTAALRQAYPARHKIVLYEAPQYPTAGPIIERVALERLPRAVVWPATTIYVPPLPDRRADPKIMRWFDEP